MFKTPTINIAVAICIALLASACGGATDEETSSSVSTTVSTGAPASTVPVEPIVLSEPPPEQFCNAGWTFLDARDAGFAYFDVPPDEVKFGPFADLYTAQTVMLGWGPEATELDLELIGSGLVALEKVFADHGYDPASVRSTSDGAEQQVLQRFDDGDVAASIRRILEAWDFGCVEEFVDDVPAPTTTTVPLAVDADPFCASDNAVLEAMDALANAGDVSHADFLEANSAFFDALADWTPADAVQLQAFDLREIWIELGGVYAATGDQGATVEAFQAIESDPDWLTLRADVDAWRDGRC